MISPIFNLQLLFDLSKDIYEVLARLEATESSDDSRPRCCREQRMQHRAGLRSPAWVRTNLGTLVVQSRRNGAAWIWVLVMEL